MTERTNDGGAAFPEITKVTIETWHPSGIKKDFAVYNDHFRKIRASTGRSLLDKCVSCGCKFGDGDPIGIVLFKDRVNDVICHPCADRMLAAREPKPEAALASVKEQQ